MGQEAEVLSLDDLDGIVDEPVSGKDRLAKEFNIEIGDPDSLCSTILELVIENRFDVTLEALGEYQKSKETYPQYKAQTSRYFDHCVELIHAIRSKNGFTNNSNLTKAKQQEIKERVKEHYRDLKKYLIRIGRVELDLKMKDARSTIWVVNALFVCTLFMVIIAVVHEGFYTMGKPFKSVVEDVIRMVFELFGL
jgi:hypothetical protein